MWKKLVKDIWAWKINVWSVSGMHTSFSSCSIPYYRWHHAQTIYDSRSSDDTATHIQESQRSTSKWKHDIRDNVKKSWREYLFNQLSYEEDRRLATKRTTDRASLRNFVATADYDAHNSWFILKKSAAISTHRLHGFFSLLAWKKASKYQFDEM